METQVEAGTVRTTEETTTYIYGYTVALEPGEGAPDFAKHADVEEADTGWDKIERVHRITYTTTNKELAREHEFTLLGIEGEVSFSWGTVDGDVIEPGEYGYADDTKVDIYTDEGAADALRFAEEDAEKYAVEQAAREVQRKAEEAERNARLAEVLKGAGIEVTEWSLSIALLAGHHLNRLAHNTSLSRNQRKFSTHYEHTLYSHPHVEAARAQGEALIREAQGQQARLEGAAKSALHVQATRILDAVRVAVQS